MNNLLLKAIKSGNPSIYIQEISNKLHVNARQVKKTIDGLKFLIKTTAEKNNVSIEEVINNPKNYGILGTNN